MEQRRGRPRLGGHTQPHPHPGCTRIPIRPSGEGSQAATKAGTQEGTRAATRVATKVDTLLVTLVVTQEGTRGATLGVSWPLTPVTVLVGMRGVMVGMLVLSRQQRRLDTRPRLGRHGLPRHSSVAASQGPTSHRRRPARMVALRTQRFQDRVRGR